LTQPAALHAIVRHPDPSTSAFSLELPSPFGTLRLDLEDSAFVLAHPQGLTVAEEEAANDAFQAARGLYDPSAPEISERAMRDVVRTWPLWGGGHGALHDLYKFQGRMTEAIYHLRQLIALQPTYEHLISLGELLGRLGRYDEARMVQEHLWAERDHAAPGLVEPDPKALVYRAVGHLLVTLTRQQRGDRMVQVADEALAWFGEDSTLRYQRALGLMLDGRQDDAREACKASLARLKADDPMVPRFRQMAGMLGV
jgi:tetratricopeptide (TPR) repeat protein